MNPGESMLLPALLFHKPGFFLYSVTQMLMPVPSSPHTRMTALFSCT